VRDGKVVVYKNGVWDLLHAGHLNVLRIAKGLGDFLVVGVATDAYTEAYKGSLPVVSFHDRLRLISELRVVDAAVPYESPEDMRPVELFSVDVVVIDEFTGIGDGPHAQRQRSFREKLEARSVRFIRVPRTPGISSTQIKESIL